MYELRPRVTKRIRGRRLQRIRAEYFRLHPLCAHCYISGRYTVATELDHIIPIYKGGKEEDSNRQGLCHDCHERKTARDLDKVYKPGGDTSGMPIDPDHPWNSA